MDILNMSYQVIKAFKLYILAVATICFGSWVILSLISVAV